MAANRGYHDLSCASPQVAALLMRETATNRIALTAQLSHPASFSESPAHLRSLQRMISFKSLTQWLSSKFSKKAGTTIRSRKHARYHRSYRPLSERLECRLALATVASFDGTTLTFTSDEFADTVYLVDS